MVLISRPVVINIPDINVHYIALNHSYRCSTFHEYNNQLSVPRLVNTSYSVYVCSIITVLESAYTPYRFSLFFFIYCTVILFTECKSHKNHSVLPGRGKKWWWCGKDGVTCEALVSAEILFSLTILCLATVMTVISKQFHQQKSWSKLHKLWNMMHKYHVPLPLIITILLSF